MAANKIKGQVWNGPIAKIYRYGMTCSRSMENVMLLSLNEQLFYQSAQLQDCWKASQSAMSNLQCSTLSSATESLLCMIIGQ